MKPMTVGSVVQKESGAVEVEGERTDGFPRDVGVYERRGQVHRLVRSETIAPSTPIPGSLALHDLYLGVGGIVRKPIQHLTD